jgi:predicted RNA-binding protein YlxR (DUF448 family)
MTRIVRTVDGVQIDPTGKLAGRGAYLHDRQECWERGLKGTLAHALKATISSEEFKKLEEFMSTLPQDAEEAGAVPKVQGSGE